MRQDAKCHGCHGRLATSCQASLPRATRELPLEDFVSKNYHLELVHDSVLKLNDCPVLLHYRVPSSRHQRYRGEPQAHERTLVTITIGEPQARENTTFAAPQVFI